MAQLQSSSHGEPSGGALPGVAPLGADLAAEAFRKMLYAVHPTLGNTALRAMALCQTLGGTLKLSPQDLQTLVWAAALHDISLVAMDRGLVRRWLRGPEKCTDEEMVLIKRHPELSQKMLDEFACFQDAASLIRSHHEHWDGTGYPDGLKGEMIPWLARLLGVVIAYCGKHAPSSQAMAAVETEAGSRFDSEAVIAVAKAAPLATMPRGEREILLTELEPGLVLAREICNANGFGLFPKGHEITGECINKLLNIHRVTPLDPLVLVFN